MKPTLCAAALLLCLTHCNTPAQKDAKPTATKPDAAKPEATAPAPQNVDVSFLLSMSYAEASSICPAKAELANVRIAGDTVDVLHSAADGKPDRVRARGRVFVEVDFPDGETARALAQEAYVSDSEVILRGRPVVQRGVATLEGLTDQTVFFLFGNQVRAIGTHRATSQQQLIQDLPTGLPGWENAPNPLLPPLAPTDVPDSIRAELNKALEAEAILKANHKPLPTGATVPAPDSAKPARP
jgi:hypothetical protein